MIPLHVGVQATRVSIEELERRAAAMDRALSFRGRPAAHITGVASSPPYCRTIITPPSPNELSELPHLNFLDVPGLLKVTVEFDDEEFYKAASADDDVLWGIRLEICHRLGAQPL